MADDPFLGRVIADKYVVESFIGGGSMGAVYKARQTALHRVVAIKVMYPELAKDREFVARFRREAHAASRLAHTNSITITDFGEESDGLLYLVMEFVDGPSLEDLIENGEPLPEERIVDIMSQILSALAAAHDAGIVHRDLKPANVLVVQKFDDDGRPIDHVKVCDFGVASLKDVTEAVLRPSQDGLGAVTQAYAEAARRQVPRPAARQLTMAGAVVGTPAYMSSEQASGKSQDARSDLYSLGVVMFEMLTRRLPFDGHSAEELMARHIAAPVPAPIDIVPCNARLSDACVRAMQKDPSDRYPNARAMRADIRGALSFGSLGDGLTAYPASGALPHASNAYSLHPASNLPPAVTLPGLDVVPASLRPSFAERTGTQGGVSSLRTDETESSSFGKRWPVAVAAVLLVAGLLVYFTRSGGSPAGDTTAVSTAPSAAVVESAPAAPSASVLTRPAPDPVAEPTPVASTDSAVPKAAPVASGRTTKVDPAVTRPNTAPAAPSAVAVVVPPPAPQEPAPATPAAAPAAPAPAAPAAAAPAAPAYVADRAKVRIAIASTSRIQKTALLSTVSRLDVTSCYRDLLRRLGRPEGGAGTVTIDIDEDGHIVSAQPSVPAPLAGSAGCIAGKIRGQRLTTPPDTGSAGAVLSLVFEP